MNGKKSSKQSCSEQLPLGFLAVVPGLCAGPGPQGEVNSPRVHVPPADLRLHLRCTAMSSSSAPPKAVVDFVAAHSDAEVLDSGKVRCSTTGHECLPQLDVLRAHWEGKTYRKKAALVAYDFEQHAPHLVPHKQSKHLLYCTVTRQPVSRQPSAVEGHVNGKRFKRMLEDGVFAQIDATKSLRGAGRPPKLYAYAPAPEA